MNTVRASDLLIVKREITKLSQDYMRRRYGNVFVAYRGITGREHHRTTTSLTLNLRTAKFHTSTRGKNLIIKYEVRVDDVLAFSDAIGKGTFDEKEIIVHTRSLKPVEEIRLT